MSKLTKAYHDAVKLLKKHQVEIEIALAALSVLGVTFSEIEKEVQEASEAEKMRLPSDPEITI